MWYVERIVAATAAVKLLQQKRWTLDGNAPRRRMTRRGTGREALDPMLRRRSRQHTALGQSLTWPGPDYRRSPEACHLVASSHPGRSKATTGGSAVPRRTRLWMDDTILGALLTTLGVAMGFVLGRIDGWLERARQREALATALLAELRAAEAALRQYVAKPGLPVFDTLQLPVLQGNVADLTLFSGETAERLVHFHQLVVALKGHIEAFRHQGGTAPSRNIRDGVIAASAAYCLRQLPDLATSLRREGGGTGFAVRSEAPVTLGEIPPIPDRVFPAISEET